MFHLFEGVFELLHADHPRRFCQKLRGHQIHKVLKVHSATDWRGNQKKRFRTSVFHQFCINFGPNEPLTEDFLINFCYQKLTVHVDVLAQLDQLHLRGHVAHRPHQIAQVLAADQPILVFIKLIECITQLCRSVEKNIVA